MERRMDEGVDALASEFHRLTGMILPRREPNRLEDRIPRKDVAFTTLATWCFDHPQHVERLRAWARHQAERQPEPRTWELLGYLEYLGEDWGAAARAFMRSLEAEPENLDAWVDLAFSCKHLGLDLGEAILFDHDEWIRLQVERGGPLTLAALYRLKAEVEAGDRNLRSTAAGWIAPFLSGS